MSEPLMLEDWVREALRCPVTGTVLREVQDHDGVWLVNASTSQPLRYPVHDGVPVLLAQEAQPVHGSHTAITTDR